MQFNNSICNRVLNLCNSIWVITGKLAISPTLTTASSSAELCTARRPLSTPWWRRWCWTRQPRSPWRRSGTAVGKEAAAKTNHGLWDRPFLVYVGPFFDGRINLMNSNISIMCHQCVTALQAPKQWRWTRALSVCVRTNTSVTQIWSTDGSGRTRRSGWVEPLERTPISPPSSQNILDMHGRYVSAR
jgi:hypothetical protein